MTPESVARIVERRDQASLIDGLREADSDFNDPHFESALADALRAEPQLIDNWMSWSGDQRWSPSAYVDGREAGWFDGSGSRQHVRVHLDEGAAVADFIHRLVAWLARHKVIETLD
jgi:hypothetical protein